MQIDYEELRRILKSITKWMEKSPENTPAKLADLLGYKSTNTIYSWFNKRKIPQKEFNNIKRVIGEPKHDTNQTCIKKVSTS